jgi:hypothetical protein
MSTDDSAPPSTSINCDESCTLQACDVQRDEFSRAARDITDFVVRVTSDAKIDANRKNAKKSTGPKTTRGKLCSRSNATKHGAFSVVRLIPGEDERAHDELSERLALEVGPKTVVETVLVEQIVGDIWRLKRVEQAEQAYFEQIRLAARMRALRAQSAEGLRVVSPIDGGEQRKSSSGTVTISDAGQGLTRSANEGARGRYDLSAANGPNSNLGLAETHRVQNNHNASSEAGMVMLDGMVDPGRAFPYDTLEAIRRSLVRDILRKNAKLSQIKRGWPQGLKTRLSG